MFIFNHQIGHDFVNRLNAEYERGGWWRAIVSDTDLFIAIREDYLNVYHNGASLLKLTFMGDRLVGETHYKYLLRADVAKPYIPVDGGMVKLPDAAALFHADLSNLGALKRAPPPMWATKRPGCIESSRATRT
jgi:hypothetical protein